MVARILDGKALSARLRARVRQRAEAIAQHGLQPGLAVVLVGENPASQLYVNNKVRACVESGIRSFRYSLPRQTSETELLALICRLNADEQVHGILVQLPLPDHIDVRRVLETIAIEKDVDGFHAQNVGHLTLGHPRLPSCTPAGVMALLDDAGIDPAGKNAVVIGASNIVGKPMALMLLSRGATVTVCHAQTRDLTQHTVLADIVVVAAGCPKLVQKQMIQSGAVIVDVGINRLPDGSIVGDVDFDQVKTKAGWISPVPGGVGPMTVTMLMENTLRAAEYHQSARLAE